MVVDLSDCCSRVDLLLVPIGVDWHHVLVHAAVLADVSAAETGCTRSNSAAANSSYRACISAMECNFEPPTRKYGEVVALKAAASSFGRVVTTRDTETGAT